MEKVVFDRLTKAIERCSIDDSKAAANEIVKHGVDPVRAVEEGIVPGLSTLWKGFDDGEVFLPELILGAETAEAAIQILTSAFPKVLQLEGE